MPLHYGHNGSHDSGGDHSIRQWQCQSLHAHRLVTACCWRIASAAARFLLYQKAAANTMCARMSCAPLSLPARKRTRMHASLIQRSAETRAARQAQLQGKSSRPRERLSPRESSHPVGARARPNSNSISISAPRYMPVVSELIDHQQEKSAHASVPLVLTALALTLSRTIHADRHWSLMTGEKDKSFFRQQLYFWPRGGTETVRAENYR